MRLRLVMASNLFTVGFTSPPANFKYAVFFASYLCVAKQGGFNDRLRNRRILLIASNLNFTFANCSAIHMCLLRDLQMPRGSHMKFVSAHKYCDL